MANDKIFHNVVKLWSGTDGALATAGAGVEGADQLTSEWIDTSGWTDKVVAWEVDSAGTIDFNVTAHISSQGSYELNNKTCTTEDYVASSIVDAATTSVYTRKDATDNDDLQRPCRSMRIVIDNDQAEPVTGCQVWLEGWS